MASFYNRTKYYKQLNRPITMLGLTQYTWLIYFVFAVFIFAVCRFTFPANFFSIWAILINAIVFFLFRLLSVYYDIYFFDKTISYFLSRVTNNWDIRCVFSKAFVVGVNLNFQKICERDKERLMLNSNKAVWFLRNWLVWLKYGFIARGNSKIYDIPVSHFKKNFAYNKNDSLSVLVKLDGLDFCSLKPEDSQRRFQNLLNLLKEDFFEDVVLSVYSHRKLVSQAKPNFRLRSKSEFCAMIDYHWKRSFKYDAYNEHYILLTTDISFRSKVGSAFSLGGNAEEKLKGALDSVLKTLSGYNLSVCTKEEFTHFMSEILFFRSLPYMLKDDYLDAEYSDDLEFYPDHIHLLEQPVGKYVGYLVLKSLSESAEGTLSDSLMHNLLVAHGNILVAQHFSKVPQEQIISSIEKQKEGYAKKKNTQLIKQELSQILENLNAGNLSMYQTRSVIQLQAESLEKLKDLKLNIQNLIRQNGANANIISKNTAAIYTSLHPIHRSLNNQLNIISNENVCNLITLTTMTKGRNTNYWSNSLPFEKREAVQQFATTYGNIFNFNFHITEQDGATGHTLIIGGTGSGKTLLAEFLMASTLKYPHVKVRSFDSMRGQYIFTKLANGFFQSFDGSCKINPCDLDFVGNAENIKRAIIFLKGFLMTMGGKNLNDSEKQLIDSEVSKYIEMGLQNNYSQRDYNMLALLDRFRDTSTETKRNLAKKLNRYIQFLGTDPEALRKNLFIPINDGKSLLSFERQLCTFDFYDLSQGNPEERDVFLGLVSSYLIYKLYSDSLPMLIFVDELPAYIKSNIFLTMVEDLLNQVRKKNKVMLAATQKIGQIFDVSSHLFTSFSSFFIFPIPNMTDQEKKILSENVKLSDRDIHWLQNTSPDARQVLLAQLGGKLGAESVRLNVNLSSLGPFINCFSSESNMVQRFKTIEYEASQRRLKGDQELHYIQEEYIR